MSDFITLSCPSCGGRLDITDDVERFVCAHCGNEHIVKRSGGMIYLKKSLADMASSMEKNTAELALPRLKGEIAELTSKIQSIDYDIRGKNSEIEGLENKHKEANAPIGKKLVIRFLWLVIGYPLPGFFMIMLTVGILESLGLSYLSPIPLICIALTPTIIVFFIILLYPLWENNENKLTYIRKQQQQIREDVQNITAKRNELEKTLQLKQSQFNTYKAITEYE